jgi:hypothetical protein
MNGGGEIFCAAGWVGGWVKREGREEINVYLYMLICMVGF